MTNIPNTGYDDKGKPDNGAADSSKDQGAASRQELGNQESNPSSGASGAVDPKEQALNNDASQNTPGNIGFRKEKGDSKGRFGKMRNLKPNKKQVATIAIIGIIAGGGFFSVAILSGPFQFIHMAQKFQKHFKSNQDFSNDRTSKMILYAIAGKDLEKSRLGIGANVLADKWEKKFLDKSGLRPVYSDPFRRHVGFEIVNESKFLEFTQDQSLKDNRTSRKLDNLMGSNSELVNANNVTDSGNTKLNIVNSEGRVSNDARILSLAKQDFKQRRAMTKTLAKATDTFGVVSAAGSRLLIKRGGVSLHPMSKLKDRADQAGASRIQSKEEKQKQIEEERKNMITNGVEVGPNGVEVRGKDNPDGTAGATTTDDQKVSDDTKSIIDDFKSSGTLRTARSAAIVTGVLCIAKHYGNSAEDFKYTNNVKPMMRMGMSSGVATGNQIMAFDDFDMETLNILSQYLYDKENKTSWNQAESIRAEEGKTGGVPMPKEAEVGSLTEKPKLFRVLDDIPVLGTVCDVQDFIGGLPVIKQVGDAVGSIMEESANAALSLAGAPSTDQLMEMSLKAVTGAGVNPDARGANFGNMGNAGTFYAANDQALTIGSKALSNVERAEIVALDNESMQYDDSLKSFASRYLDPYNGRSVTGTMLTNAPTNASQAASMLSSSANVVGSSLSTFASLFSPKVSAAGLYDYGVPKFGYSVEEQQRAGFQYEYENPYENAYKYVEPELDSLNSKYGKCFGMTVHLKENGVSIKSEDKSVNVFKTYNPNSDDYEPDCDANTNTDDKFNHYRFYLADAVTAVTLACLDGDDEEACAEIGLPSGQDTTNTVPGEGAGKIVSVAEQEFEKNGNKVLETCGQNCGPEVQKYTGGPSGSGAPWCAWFVSWVYREAGYEFKGAPAGSDGNIPYVGNLATWFKENGIHFTRESDTKPQPGDVIMYGGDEHTGIVVKVNGDTIETIEGNTSSDNNFSANGGTVGKKSFNYKTYSSRSLEFGRLKSF